MKISVDISYYPLAENYLQPISDFIARLNKNEGLLVRTTTMSTQIIGDFKQVMNTISQEIEKSFEMPSSVFVLKIVNMDLTEMPKS